MNKKKICLIVSSLGKGGAERCTAIQSKMLFELGYDVHIISILNLIDYTYSGKLYNLGILKDADNTRLGRLKRFIKFRTYIRNHKFDVIIDNRTRSPVFRELLIQRLIYSHTRNLVYVVHSFNLNNYFPSQNWARQYLAKKSKKIVTVSRGIQDKLNEINIKNTHTIYNPVGTEDFKLTSKNSIDNSDFILFYGRLDDKVKNIKLLIEAYHQSILPNKNIKLVILGDGPDKDKLETFVSKLEMDKMIQFKAFLSNPFKHVLNSKFAVLTSRYEGFPMVIPEVLSLGVPFVSVDCNSGPREIIKNRFNGLLVPNHNKKLLAEAFNEMILNENLYLYCKSNAKDSVKHLNYNKIQNDWKILIESL